MNNKRTFLQEIEIVGATMVYQEGEVCRWSLDWLYANCDRVCILLDNWNATTEEIVMEYKNKHPERTRIVYSTENVNEDKNSIQGQIKKRFKNRQAEIREQVLVEVRKMHEEKPIDILVWPDSDETFINEFTKYLEEFWNDHPDNDYMMVGFLEVYDKMDQIITQKMSPHGRVYKYKPEITALPSQARTVYHPYEAKRPWKVRHLVVHVCHLKAEYRERRQFFSNRDMKTECHRLLWKLPKDVREMTPDEIAKYQFGHRQAPPEFPPITLEEYLNN